MYGLPCINESDVCKGKNTSFLWVFHKFTLYSNWISRDTGVNWDIREIHILLLWAPRQNLTPMGALFQSYYSGFLGLYVIGLHNGRKGMDLSDPEMEMEKNG